MMYNVSSWKHKIPLLMAVAHQTHMHMVSNRQNKLNAVAIIMRSQIKYYKFEIQKR